MTEATVIVSNPVRISCAEFIAAHKLRVLGQVSVHGTRLTLLRWPLSNGKRMWCSVRKGYSFGSPYYDLSPIVIRGDA